jgi:hypothetical protein
LVRRKMSDQQLIKLTMLTPCLIKPTLWMLASWKWISREQMKTTKISSLQKNSTYLTLMMTRLSTKLRSYQNIKIKQVFKMLIKELQIFNLNLPHLLIAIARNLQWPLVSLRCNWAMISNKKFLKWAVFSSKKARLVMGSQLRSTFRI